MTKKQLPFVKWIGHDDQGKFEHIGELLTSPKGPDIVLNTQNGQMNFPVEDGELVACRRPADWKKAAPEPIKKPEKKERKYVKKSAKKGSTRLNQVIELMRRESDEDYSRKEWIEKIVAEVGMTPAGASTYYSQAKKRLTRT